LNIFCRSERISSSREKSASTAKRRRLKTGGNAKQASDPEGVRTFKRGGERNCGGKAKRKRHAMRWTKTAFGLKLGKRETIKKHERLTGQM